VPQAPEDPLFGLAREYKADDSPNKIDLVSSTLYLYLYFAMNANLWFLVRVSAHTETRMQSPGCCQSSRRYESCANQSYTLSACTSWHCLFFSFTKHSPVAYTHCTSRHCPVCVMITLPTRLGLQVFSVLRILCHGITLTMRHLDPYANLRHSLPQPNSPAATTLVIPFVLEFELTPRLS
jgi:hypothetical protein